MLHIFVLTFVLSFIKVLKISRLFHQGQDLFKTKTMFHVLEAARDKHQGHGHQTTPSEPANPCPEQGIVKWVVFIVVNC